jgi:hypothetical protein
MRSVCDLLGARPPCRHRQALPQPQRQSDARACGSTSTCTSQATPSLGRRPTRSLDGELELFVVSRSQECRELLAIPGHDVTDLPVDKAAAGGSPPAEAIVAHVGLVRSGLLPVAEPVTVGRSRSRITDASTPISTKSITSGPTPVMSSAKTRLLGIMLISPVCKAIQRITTNGICFSILSQRRGVSRL